MLVRKTFVKKSDFLKNKKTEPKPKKIKKEVYLGYYTKKNVLKGLHLIHQIISKEEILDEYDAKKIQVLARKLSALIADTDGANKQGPFIYAKAHFIWIAGHLMRRDSLLKTIQRNIWGKELKKGILGLGWKPHEIEKVTRYYCSHVELPVPDWALDEFDEIHF